MDNASSCDTLARVLGLLLFERYNIHFTFQNNRIRCLAHVVNLVVQAILNNLDEADDPEIVDDFMKHRDLPIHYEMEQDDVLREMEAEADAANSNGSSGGDASKVGDDDDDGFNDLPSDADDLSALKKVRESVLPTSSVC